MVKCAANERKDRGTGVGLGGSNPKIGNEQRGGADSWVGANDVPAIKVQKRRGKTERTKLKRDYVLGPLPKD